MSSSVLPRAVNVTVRSARPREYLTEREIDRLTEAAKCNRWGHRDGTAILLAYRHGLRASERTTSTSARQNCMYGGLKAARQAFIRLRGKELRALRRLLREMPDGQRATYLFVSERMAPLSVAGYQRMVGRAGKAAGFGFLVHSHMLRHSTGYKLANDGHDTRAIQDYLGHRSIGSTVRYTALAPDRFKHFWRD